MSFEKQVVNVLLGLNCVSKCRPSGWLFMKKAEKLRVSRLVQYLSIAEGTLWRGGKWDGLGWLIYLVGWIVTVVLLIFSELS